MEKQTLGEKTAQMLLEMIQKEGFGPGDKLPTEAELVESLGVGRNTVREALRILMSRNIVTIRQGSGTFISEKKGVVDDPLGFSMMEDRRRLTEDLIHVRLMLEPEIAMMAAGTSAGSTGSPECCRRGFTETGTDQRGAGRSDPSEKGLFLKGFTVS